MYHSIIKELKELVRGGEKLIFISDEYKNTQQNDDAAINKKCWKLEMVL